MSKLTARDVYLQARYRLERSPALRRYRDLFTWPEDDARWRWVLTTPVSELAAWAARVFAERGIPDPCGIGSADGEQSET